MIDQKESRDILKSLSQFGIQMGLERIQALLAELGHPQTKFRSVHVAGTNGKGSTSAFIASALTAAGLRTGLYTSPHLVDYPERFKIDGKEISWEKFAGVLHEVKMAVDRIVAAGAESPTEFEVLTAVAFLWYASEQVDYAVIEAGLGGRLDSTNVVNPVVSVITNVGLDHMDRCGDTVEQIAEHKAGIIKPGVPVVTGADAPALDVIREVAKQNDSTLSALAYDFGILGYQNNKDSQTFKFQSDMMTPDSFSITLRGKHQVLNAALAIQACRYIAVTDDRLTKQAIVDGLASTSWPGRFEVFGENPPIIIDGAHNPDGAKALRKALDDYDNKSSVFIFGILADKDYLSFIKNLFLSTDRVIVVRPDSERAADPEIIAGEIRKMGLSAEVAFDLRTALQNAVELAGTTGRVCVTGSLYMIGGFREMLRHMQ